MTVPVMLYITTVDTDGLLGITRTTAMIKPLARNVESGCRDIFSHFKAFPVNLNIAGNETVKSQYYCTCVNWLLFSFLLILYISVMLQFLSSSGSVVSWISMNLLHLVVPFVELRVLCG